MANEQGLKRNVRVVTPTKKKMEENVCLYFFLISIRGGWHSLNITHSVFCCVILCTACSTNDDELS